MEKYVEKEGRYIIKEEREYTAPVIEIDGRYLSPGPEDFKRVLERISKER